MLDFRKSGASSGKMDLPSTGRRSWSDALIPRLSTPMLFALSAMGIICLLAVVLTPQVRIMITAEQVRPETGKAYITQLPAYRLYRVPSDLVDAPSRSRLVLYEDNRALSQPHSLHETIRREGRGAYSHWGNDLYFSSSDDSDPRTNGRTYVAVAPTRLSAGLEAILVLASVACFAALRRELKRRYSSAQAHQKLSRVESRPTYVSFAASVGLAFAVISAAAVLAWLAGLQYRTNDDTVMRFIAEGVSGDGSATQFLIYQNILVGLFVRSLYAWAPAIPWYDVVLAAGTLSGALLCQIAAFRLCSLRRDFAFCAIVGLLVFAPIFQALQFSASSTLLSGGALLTLTALWYRPPAERMRLGAACAVIILAFSLAAMVRLHSAIFILIMLLPMAALLVGMRRPIRTLAPPAAALACGLLVIVAADFFQAAYYASSPGWETFRLELRTRAVVGEWAQVDMLRPEQFRAALAAAQWSENDYRLVSGWLFSDRQLFSLDRMQAFAALAPKQPIDVRAANTINVLRGPGGFLWLYVALCLAVALLRRSRRVFWGVGVAIAWPVALLVLTGIVFKPNFSHIIWPLYAVAALAGAAMSFAQDPGEQERSSYLLLEDRAIVSAVLLGILALALVQIQSMFEKGAAAFELRRRVNQDLSRWPVNEADKVVVRSNNFPFEIWVEPFHPVPRVPWRFIHTGASSASPLFQPIYTSWGTSDIAWAICNVPGLSMVDARIGYAEPHARQLTIHMRDHYDQAVEVTSVFEGQALSLYRCVPRETAPRDGAFNNRQ